MTELELEQRRRLIQLIRQIAKEEAWFAIEEYFKERG